MSPLDSISLSHLAWKNISRKLFRNLVLAAAVMLLVSLLVFALLFNKAVKDDIDTATLRLGAEIVLVPAEAQSSAEEFILESQEKTFYMDNNSCVDIAKFFEAEQVGRMFCVFKQIGCRAVDGHCP